MRCQEEAADRSSVDLRRHGLRGSPGGRQRECNDITCDAEAFRQHCVNSWWVSLELGVVSSRISVLMAWEYALAGYFLVCYWAHGRLQVTDSRLVVEKDKCVLFGKECSTET